MNKKNQKTEVVKIRLGSTDKVMLQEIVVSVGVIPALDMVGIKQSCTIQ